jgi:PGF-pre-PGF domain-containing protein
LRKLAGNYTEGTDVNTSMTRVQLQNSTGSAVTTGAHVEVKVTHSSLYNGNDVNYIVESLTNGAFSMPFLNDSTVKVQVFAQNSAPRKTTLNLSSNETSITMKSFGMEVINGTGGFQDFNTSMKTGLEVKFYTYSDACNVLNPPSSCQLGSTHTGDFDPLQAMMAGKSNLRMHQTSSGTILYFINVDLLASGPPDAQMSESASTTSSSSSIQQAWQLGSLAPDIYDYVWVGLPYSGLNETWSYSVTIPYLYDENGNLIWNTSANGTNPGATLTEYADYPGAWFTGMSCSKTNSSANCYMNRTSNYFWLKIPHFSSVQSRISGSAPAAAGETSPSGSTGTVTKTLGKLTKIFTSIIPQSEGKITETDLASTGTNLREISIKVKSRATGITLIVEKHDTKPSSVAVDVTTTGKVYKYMDITASNLDSDNIEEAKIKFKVEKTWIQTNSLQEANVHLYRYSNSEWAKLDTSKTSSDDTYVYYEAVTPGFSYFAIAGEAETTATTTTTTVPGETTTTTTPIIIPPEIFEDPTVQIVVVIVVIIVIVLILWKYDMLSLKQ